MRFSKSFAIRLIFPIVLITGCRQATAPTKIEGSDPLSPPEVNTEATATLTTPNLILDPGFESGLSGFYVDTSPRDNVLRSAQSPIFGKNSLHISLHNLGGLNVWGNDAWWDQDVANVMTRGRSLSVTALVRSLA